VKTGDELTCYRIGDPDGLFPILDTEGSRLYPGRWNTAASPMRYASEHYSTAMLEKLVHLGGILPANQHYLPIRIPRGTSLEVFRPDEHPGWDGRNERIAKAFGAAWFASKRTALLIVPSLPARIERNVLINLTHPEAAAIVPGVAEPVWWDERLFGS
jgi:RES domain-containing protein